MIRRSVAFPAGVLIFFLIVACATDPQFNFAKGTRVGVVNLLESDVTHTNFSSFDQDNFTRTYAVNWEIPAYAERKLIAQLEKNKDLTVVTIQVPDPSKQKTLRLNMIERVVFSATAPPTIPPEGAKLLETIVERDHVDVVVIIGTYAGPSPYKSAENPIRLEGYGLFTRSLLKGMFEKMLGGLLSFRKAYAFAQIGVVVFRVRPVIYLGSAQASQEGRPLRPINDFDWQADIHQLPQAQLAKTRPRIEQYIDETVKKALRVTHLAPDGISPSHTGSGSAGAPAR